MCFLHILCPCNPAPLPGADGPNVPAGGLYPGLFRSGMPTPSTLRLHLGQLSIIRFLGLQSSGCALSLHPLRLCKAPPSLQLCLHPRLLWHPPRLPGPCLRLTCLSCQLHHGHLDLGYHPASLPASPGSPPPPAQSVGCQPYLHHGSSLCQINSKPPWQVSGPTPGFSHYGLFPGFPHCQLRPGPMDWKSLLPAHCLSLALLLNPLSSVGLYVAIVID